jgi:hypothetical protein
VRKALSRIKESLNRRDVEVLEKQPQFLLELYQDFDTVDFFP